MSGVLRSSKCWWAVRWDLVSDDERCMLRSSECWWAVCWDPVSVDDCCAVLMLYAVISCVTWSWKKIRTLLIFSVIWENTTIVHHMFHWTTVVYNLLRACIFLHKQENNVLFIWNHHKCLSYFFLLSYLIRLISLLWVGGVLFAWWHITVVTDSKHRVTVYPHMIWLLHPLAPPPPISALDTSQQPREMSRCCFNVGPPSTTLVQH